MTPSRIYTCPDGSYVEEYEPRNDIHHGPPYILNGPRWEVWGTDGNPSAQAYLVAAKLKAMWEDRAKLIQDHLSKVISG